MAGLSSPLLPPYLDGYGGVASVNAPNNVHPAAAAGSTDLGFVLWVLLIGIVIPVAIVGGLQVGGFRFVFKR